MKLSKDITKDLCKSGAAKKLRHSERRRTGDVSGQKTFAEPQSKDPDGLNADVGHNKRYRCERPTGWHFLK